MTYQTEVFGLTRPVPESVSDEDEGKYADILEGIDDDNGFIPDFEGAVAFHGPLADRPNSAPFDVLYHATDTGEWSRFDSDLGQWTPTSAHVDEARERYDSVQGPRAVYQQAGAGRLGDLRHTQQTVGTRRMACQWPLVGGRGPGNFAYTNSGVNERVQVIRYSFLEQPPNMVPILRATPSISSDTSGETFEVGIKLKSQPAGSWLMTFTAGTDTNTHTLYDEVRLDEAPYGSAARGPNTLMDSAIEVHADIDGTPTAGTIVGGSALALDWEVV